MTKYLPTALACIGLLALMSVLYSIAGDACDPGMPRAAYVTCTGAGE